MKVLLAVVISPATVMCSLGFAVSMLRLQTAMHNAPTPLQAVLEIVPSLRAAVSLAAADSSFHSLVAVSSHLTFSPNFVLRALASGKPFVAGVYPLPRLDWERVRAKASSPAEKPEYRGNVYNIDAAKAKFTGGGFMEVPAGAVEPGAVVLTREALEALAPKMLPPNTPATDDEVPLAWGRPIAVDIDQQLANFGPVDFFGCVGMRTALR